MSEMDVETEQAASVIDKAPQCESNNETKPAIETKADSTTQENNETRHWDHTTRKVIVRGIFEFTKPKELENMMKAWTDGTTMKITKHKKPPRGTWVLLTLEDNKMVEPFLKIFEDGAQRNKRGGVINADRAGDNDARDDNDNRDRNGKKRKDNDKRGPRENSKKMRTAPEECVKSPDQVRDTLTPFWKLPYEQQLKIKTRTILKKCIRRITTDMKSKFRTLEKELRRSSSDRKQVDPVYDWIKNQIRMEKIISAPQRVEYRNKSELTFGYAHDYEANVEQDVTGVALKKKIIKSPAVGFMAAGWSGGVSKPHCLQNIPGVVCGIADIVNKFLCDSPVPPYNSRVHQGIWRYLTIRTSERTNECMIIITHAPSSGGVGKRDDGADDYSKVFESEKERLTKMLTTCDIPMPVRNYPASHQETETETGKNEKSSLCVTRVTSLFFQEYEGLSNPLPEHPVQHAYGKEFLEERLLQCKFQISPGAFFQVATEGAEALYNVVVEKVREVTEKPNETMLFDVCCGTGTIGLTCLKEGAVGKVVGIDISEPAIKDAIANVTRNEFPTTVGVTKFVASRAEAAMREEIRKVETGCPIVAVVDPAREGLHQDVCRALRNEKKIQRVVYVSCNPTGSLIKDAIMLCCPQTKKYTGLPFKPTLAQPVDMFPQTDHCELVLVFDRMSQSECDGGITRNDNVSSEVEDNKNDVVPTKVEDGKDDIASDGV